MESITPGDLTRPSPSQHTHHPTYPPTYTLQYRELRGKVDYIQARHEKFLRVVKSTNTASDPGFKELHSCK